VAADGAEILIVISSADVEVAHLDDGVACWRRHSAGLRWRSDIASPRAENCAWENPSGALHEAEARMQASPDEEESAVDLLLSGMRSRC